MSTLSDNQVTVYEEPVHERIRKFLRIEMLFNRINYLKDKESEHESYSSAVALTELYEMLTRSNLKAELIRDLESHHVFFKKIRESNKPGTDSSKLNSILEKQESHLSFLHSIEANYLDYLDKDELFQTIIKYSKNSIHPSSLIYWLSRDSLSRENQINLWLEPINFINQSVEFLLTTIRKSVVPVDQLAKNGFFTDKLDSKKNILLIRVALTSDHYFFPSISVGKQRFSIRFMTQNDENKFIPHKLDVEFFLSCCSM